MIICVAFSVPFTLSIYSGGEITFECLLVSSSLEKSWNYFETSCTPPQSYVINRKVTMHLEILA